MGKNNVEKTVLTLEQDQDARECQFLVYIGKIELDQEDLWVNLGQKMDNDVSRIHASL